MKPHIKPVGCEYWIFSSKKASLDCIPQYKCLNMNSVMAMLNRMKVNNKEK